jgi:beta-glucanase (GH16 family)
MRRARHARVSLVVAGVLAVGFVAGCNSAHTPTPSVLGNQGVRVQTAAKLPGKWKLLLNENFSGTKLNTNRWQSGWFGTGITKSVNTESLNCNSTKQVRVSGGMLRITAARQRTRCGSPLKTQPYVSGLVSTNPETLGAGKGFAFKYGLIEFRAKIAGTGKGKCADWPTMWIDGQDWPKTGEIDAFECLGGFADWHLHSGVTGGAFPAIGAIVKGKWTGWHTFAVDWERTKATFYYDGHKVGSHTYLAPAANYIVIDDDVHDHANTRVPSTLDVDWVRVWQHSTAKTAKPIRLAADSTKLG